MAGSRRQSRRRGRPGRTADIHHRGGRTAALMTAGFTG